MNLPTVALDARLVGGSNTGDSTYWTGLVNGLAECEPRAIVLLLSNAAAPENIPVRDNIRWIRVPARSSRWWSYVTFPLAARKLGARAIHTQYALSPLVGDRGFTTIHDVSFLIGPQWFKPKDRLILSRAVPAAARRAKGVFAVSETDRTEIETYIPSAEGKVTVTFNACPSWIQAVEPQAAKLRIKRELGIEGPYLLTVGTRWPRKNMVLAVEAANALPEKLPHRLVITGKAGWGDAELGARGVAVGYVSEDLLSCLYSAAALYLAPSHHEGFGVPLLEAFRCGCPVVCSSGGALPEVASNAAIVMQSWDAAAWTEAIQDVLADSSKIELLRQAGRRREKDFSWEETARRTLNAYLGATD